MENRQKATKQEQLAILRGLVDADAFERFLAAKFPASKVCAAYTASVWCKQAFGELLVAKLHLYIWMKDNGKP